MFNDRGEKVNEALPSMPVEVLGLDDMPNAGDPFQVTETEKDARAISAKRQELKRFEAAKAVKKINLDNFASTIQANEVNELKVIIKADLQGSAEALKTSLEKLSTPEIRLNVIHSSAGAINESDVTLAAADGNAILIGFNVRPTPKAKLLADQEKVDIRKYNVIYKCVEEITLAMEGMLKPDTKEEVTGQLEVRNTFKVPKVGLIAGCYVTEGVVKRTSSVNLIRDGIVKHTGKISSLKRFKDDAKEVTYGFECGVGLENWQDIQEGDILEVFEYVEIARKLGDAIAKEKEAEAAKAELPNFVGKSVYNKYRRNEDVRGIVPDLYMVASPAMVADDGADEPINVLTKVLLDKQDRFKEGRNILCDPKFTQVGIAHEVFEEENWVVCIFATRFVDDEPEVDLPKDDLTELKKAFDILDTNGRGKLDMAEIKKAMDDMRFYQTDPDLYSILKDLSDTEKCSWPKFASYAHKKMTDRKTTEGLETIFSLFIDNPDKETINFETFKKICNELDAGLSEKELKDILESSTNNGKEITFEEFEEYMRNIGK